MGSNKKFIIVMGISGSGKTAFANRYAKEHSDTVVVNQDIIRKEITGDISNQTKNAEVADEALRRLDEAFDAGKNVIWDNTSLRMEYVYDIYLRAPEGYDIDIYYTERSFYPLACMESIHNDIKTGVERSNVPDRVVERQYENFIKAMKLVTKPLKKIPVF